MNNREILKQLCITLISFGATVLIGILIGAIK